MKWLLYSGGLLIIIFIAYIYFSFNGTPWGKVAFQKQAIQHIDKKYSVDFTIKVVSYSFKNAQFSAYFYLDDSKSEIFTVYVTKSGLRDNYLLKKWELEAKAKLQPLIDRNFNAETESFFEINRNDLTEKQEMITTMPSYYDIREELHPYTTLLIRINRKFNEYKDVPQLQHFLRDMNNAQMNVQSLTIMYRESNSKFEEREVFEIFSEFGDKYHLDRILEYKAD